ncbi:protoporphyrinogen oxidase-like [Asterias amurensis]|uniref:protoporphyrinogen oxidase-like n=1 Tax=Asterias amurensis TaxID=7602 RepID=UPI003AB74783
MALRGGKVDFLVLGGGVGGLSAVFYLQRLLAAAETENSKDTQENPTSKELLTSFNERKWRSGQFGLSKIARVHTSDAVWETDRLICALPAKNLVEVLPVDLDPLSDHLQDVNSATVAVINLEYEGSHLPTEGFGYLVTFHERSNVLGLIFDLCAFPQHDRPGPKTTRITCMMGGAWFHELFGDPDKVDPEWLASVAMETLKSQIGLVAKTTYCKVNLSKDVYLTIESTTTDF